MDGQEVLGDLREGIVRFAECTSPGEARDQSVWVSALNALE